MGCSYSAAKMAENRLKNAKIPARGAFELSKKVFFAIFEQQAALNGPRLCSLISQLGLGISHLLEDGLANFNINKALA